MTDPSNARAEARTPLQSLKRQALVGAATIALLIFGLGGWAVSTNLTAAVVAPGSIVVEGSVRKVQHPTGGVVGEIRVKDGDLVQAGEIVLRLDETVTRANLAVVTKTLDELTLRRIRLEAERDGLSELGWPPEVRARSAVEPDFLKSVQGEETLYSARRNVLQGQRSQLSERVKQIGEEVKGLEIQIAAKREQLRLIAQELEGLEKLFKQNLVPITRLIELKRENARLSGEEGQFVAEMARARARIAETELQLLSLDQEQRKEVSTELRDVQAKLGEYVERKVTAEDQLKRIELRAPISGAVHQLAVHTVGGVIGPAEQVMLIVPTQEALTIEVRIQPQDIDQIALGQTVFVRFSAFHHATTPEVLGKLTRVSADLTTDQRSGASWYTGKVAVSDEELKKLEGQRLLPGMPVEAYVRTADRTALTYLTKPLTDQIARAFREE